MTVISANINGASPAPDVNIKPTDQFTVGEEGSSSILDEFNLSVISKMILESELYQQAYNILSADKAYGHPFLQQLKAIPYGYSVREENFWDNIASALGGTSGFEHALQDAFNSAMDDIRTLMQNYYAFRNSLPAEQVQQLAEAGINAAITGQDVDSSVMPTDDSIGAGRTPSAEGSSNSALSQGVSSFVEFISSMANIASVGFNADSLMGMLDIAEREGYNKQELHDYMLSQAGITTPSKYRVLTPDNTPAVKNTSRVAVGRAAAEASALDGSVSVHVGNDPDGVAQFEVLSGQDVLNEVSKYALANQFAEGAISFIRNGQTQLYADILGSLEGQYQLNNYAAMIEQQNFNKDFFSNRNGVLEGFSESSLRQSLASLRESEAAVESVNVWLAEYRQNVLSYWGEQLSDKPYLAPYFYKGLLDFNMADTFYHQSPVAQAFRYTQDGLQSIGSFLSNLTGFKKPKLPTRRTVTQTSGPKGISTTVSETTSTLE